MALNTPSPYPGAQPKTKASEAHSPCQNSSPVLKSTYCAFAACQLKIILVRTGVAGAESYRRFDGGRLCPLLAALLPFSRPAAAPKNEVRAGKRRAR